MDLSFLLLLHCCTKESGAAWPPNESRECSTTSVVQIFSAFRRQSNNWKSFWIAIRWVHNIIASVGLKEKKHLRPFWSLPPHLSTAKTKSIWTQKHNITFLQIYKYLRCLSFFWQPLLVGIALNSCLLAFGWKGRCFLQGAAKVETFSARKPERASYFFCCQV